MRRLLRLGLWLALPARLAAQDTTRAVVFGAFVDTYYAWDANGAAAGDFDRPYVTQPARQDEFNVNLAFVEARLTGPRVRGRLALQAGTAVQANYAGEPRTGAVAGPDLSRLIQEAVVGVRVAPPLWVDAGVYFSHIGQESWISAQNPTYTRSLIAEFSPYYEAGVKATWTVTPRLTAQLDLLNGWQDIADVNRDRAVGVRLEYAVTPRLSIGYDNFIGNVAPDTAPSQPRVFNEVLAAWTDGATQLWLTFDYGVQRRAPAPGNSTWFGGAAVVRRAVSRKVALAGRLEDYEDGDGVVVTTAAPGGYRVAGASLGVDVSPEAGVLWRTEVRALAARAALFPLRAAGAYGRRDAFVVSSLALTF
jgi:Putative beta-barrel porin-2, OmpL-like. bbp2